MSSAESKSVVILIAEDDFRMSAADILQDGGYHVVGACEGVEALAVLEVRNDVTAIFTDVQKPNPGKSGTRTSSSSHP